MVTNRASTRRSTRTINIFPDYMELKDFPFLWYQTEYVIGGAATYIFDVLAAHKLANE